MKLPLNKYFLIIKEILYDFSVRDYENETTEKRDRLLNNASNYNTKIKLIKDLFTNQGEYYFLIKEREEIEKGIYKV